MVEESAKEERKERSGKRERAKTMVQVRTWICMLDWRVMYRTYAHPGTEESQVEPEIPIFFTYTALLPAPSQKPAPLLLLSLQGRAGRMGVCIS